MKYLLSSICALTVSAVSVQAAAAQSLLSSAAKAEMEEKIRRLQAEVEDMKALNTSLTTSLNNLSQQVKNQNSAMKKIVESYERALKGFADQGAVDALEKSVRAVEKARKADQAQVARKLADLKKIILENSSRPPIVITQNSSSHSGGRPAREPNIVEHVIKKGETVMDILLAYNGALKQEGRKPSISLQRIRQANPTVNLDRIRVGQKLLIPIID